MGEQLKTAARAACNAERDALVKLSHAIHAHPELAFEEERACAWLCDFLGSRGLRVEKGAYGVPTAFVARAGSGPLHIAICAEYDALPAVGHACGHNIIAASSAGAGLALARIADDLGITVSVIGTPAEERGNDSGKVRLLDRGAFDDVDAAMMVHPAPVDMLAAKLIAASMFDVQYTGKEAHASAFPEQGINAADALTIAQVAVGLLRQHILQTDRIHGIVTKGGDAANIVPAHTSARFMIRSEKIGDLHALREKVRRCFEAGAIATGAKLEIVGGDKPYTEMAYDHGMNSFYKRNAEALGRKFPDLGPMGERLTASTDMGNVSLAVPSIHPMIGIDSAPASNHQPEFTRHCITPAADQALMDAAVGMAWTVIDMATDPATRQRLETRERPFPPR